MNLSIATPATTPTPSITLPCPVIILGRDDNGRPHASFFPATDTRAAEKAAELMSMAALKVEGDELRAFLGRLPQGKLFDSGKAFVPFVKQDLYQAIAAHLSNEERERLEKPRVVPEKPAAEAEYPVPPKNMPESWDQLTVGSLVLATEGPLEGWFEATVIKIEGDTVVRLKWRDYLDMLPFSRHVDQVALIHPCLCREVIAMSCALQQNISEDAAGRAASIRDKNDAFRKSLSGGRVLLTPGITNLTDDHQRAVISGVKAFDDFSTDNDPYGEHDFGAVTVEDAVFFWKIDYYDLDLQFGSSDPTDDDVTCRVLTVMRADEY